MNLNLNKIILALLIALSPGLLPAQTLHSSAARFPVPSVPPSIEPAADWQPSLLTAQGFTHLRQILRSSTEVTLSEGVNPKRNETETRFDFNAEGQVVKMSRETPNAIWQNEHLEFYYLPGGRASHTMHYLKLKGGRDSLIASDTVLYFEQGKIIECWTRKTCAPGEDCFWHGRRFTYSSPGGDLLQTDWMECEQAGDGKRTPCLVAVPLQRTVFVYDAAHRVTATEYYGNQNLDTPADNGVIRKFWTPVLLNRTDFTYDNQGRITGHKVFEQDSLTETALYVYNPSGQLEQIQITPAALNEGAPMSSEFTYFYHPSGLASEKEIVIKYPNAGMNLTMQILYKWF